MTGPAQPHQGALVTGLATFYTVFLVFATGAITI
jgi:hypothetical protein